MWKYIVTYFLIIQSTPVKQGGKTVIPYQFNEIQKREFPTLAIAKEFIKIAKKPGTQNLSIINVMLDSVYVEPPECPHDTFSVTMLLCDQPRPDCNTATCQKCGKQWPTY